MPARAARRPLDPLQLKELYERKARAMDRRPSLARGTAQVRLRLAEGLRCELSVGEQALVVDLPVAEGGGGAGPQPVELMHAGLAAALAMGYRIWAARLSVPLDGLEVEIVSEFDARGQLLPDAGVSPGWQRLVIDVLVYSEAAVAEVARVADLAQRLCPLLSVLSPAIERRFHLRVLPPGRRDPDE